LNTLFIMFSRIRSNALYRHSTQPWTILTFHRRGGLRSEQFSKVISFETGSPELFLLTSVVLAAAG
jgi:hypothetical protein